MNGYINIIYDEDEHKELTDLSTSIIQKQLKQIQ